jgi:C1A family cysteine protease
MLFLLDGVRCTDDTTLLEKTLQFYKNLFCPKETVTTHCMEVVSLPKLSQQRISNLNKHVFKEEVYVMLTSISFFKASSNDGFHLFYLKHTSR